MASDGDLSLLPDGALRSQLDKIPFHNVPLDVQREMALLLQPPPCDWKELADKLGMTAANIQALAYTSRPELESLHGLMVFEWYYSVEGNSVQEVMDSLTHLERFDVLRLLDKAISDVIARFRRSPRAKIKTFIPPEDRYFQESFQTQISQDYGSSERSTGPYQYNSYPSFSSGSSLCQTEPLDNSGFREEMGDGNPTYENSLTPRDCKLSSFGSSLSYEHQTISEESEGRLPYQKHYRKCSDSPPNQRTQKLQKRSDGIESLNGYNSYPQPIPCDSCCGHGTVTAYKHVPVNHKPQVVMSSSCMPDMSSNETLPQAMRRNQTLDWVISSTPDSMDDDVTPKMKSLNIQQRKTYPLTQDPEKEAENGKKSRTVSAGAQLEHAETHRQASREPRIYVTFDKDFSKEAATIKSHLRESEFKVIGDNHQCFFGLEHKTSAEVQFSIKRNFKKADRILVCVTPKYKDAIKPPPGYVEGEKAKPEELNPAMVVYALMKRECEQSNKKKCHRYVVILCQNAQPSDVPSLLKDNCYIFKYPQHDRDLLTCFADPRRICDNFIREQKLLAESIVKPT